MSATEVVVRLLGEISLLLWGVHMVHSGVMRAYGGPLRRWMATGLGSRPRALLFGAGVTLALQSSTATAMMATSFAETGAIALTPALAAMLGANIGSALIVQVFAFDISLVFPVFLFAGLVAFRRGARSRARDLGRAMIGVGLILLALHLLAETMRPVEGALGVEALLFALTRDSALNLALAAALTWAAHSSVAVMLFIVSMTAVGVVTPQAALAMTLGANLGSALNPLFEVGLSGAAAKRRVAAGNALNRAIGCLIALPFVGEMAQGLTRLGIGAAEAPAAFHLLFNGATALVALPLLPAIERGLNRLIVAAPDPDDPGAPRYLVGAAADAPVVALTNAARELLRLADGVETLLVASREAFALGDRTRGVEAARVERAVMRLHDAIEIYLSGLDSDALGETDNRRLAAILDFASAMKRAAERAHRGLLKAAGRLHKNQLALAPEALAEIDALHQRLIADLRIAVAVFTTGDLEAARRLASEKEYFRDLERSANERRQARVRQGAAPTDGGLELDTLRELKSIGGAIVATGYPILEQSGMLRQSRLA